MAGPWEDFERVPADQIEASEGGPWSKFKPATVTGLAPQPAGPGAPGSASNPLLIQRAKGALSSAAAPITSLPEAYQRIVSESVAQMGQGVRDLGSPGSRL